MSEFDVFVIGPMGKDKDDPAEKSTPISDHMRIIEVALRKVLPRHLPEGGFTIATPEHGGMMIEDYVFNKIDGAEFAIADISARSPSVMYELAFLHSLGTPFILIDDLERNERDVPFYCRGANIIRLNKFTVRSLISALDKRFATYFKGDQDFSLNPIEQFYGTPLAELSGASAIATGYYDNFVSGFVHRVGGVFAREALKGKDGRQLKSFKMIKPSLDFNPNRDLANFGRIARERGVCEETEFLIDIAGRTRSIYSYCIDDVIYDYPRTVSNLGSSPRLSRLALREGTYTGAVAAQAREARAKILRELIVRFNTHINRLIAINRGDLFTDRFEMISLDQFEQEIHASL